MLVDYVCGGWKRGLPVPSPEGPSPEVAVICCDKPFPEGVQVRGDGQGRVSRCLLSLFHLGFY